MIRLEIKPTRVSCLYTIFIDEKTMSVDHYEKGVTSKQLDQVIPLIQKTIDSIYNMTFSTYRYSTFTRITGENDWGRISFIDDDHKFVNIYINDKNCLISLCSISYYDFKKLLVAQHKENELSYLLLKGVFV